ncbi:type I-C CRISPR-associated protein Cas7/Csd2 [Azospirillum brasilense]|uniref:type I-C CRISPR-associated protein Cas7/Csd2 n=1 Tax=Azospirillum brasilense TaxID=192 RepID=UPI000E684B6E|nr:type I-C CRISPR-associated protein Cas7/Csd2 [Azospirillum brasilense]NUB27519.1 type I-C CRISPR-associated protein Cas7/Csd2 [Azospirillum brasilense]NUB31798.1 type I-C CRISPR-associated protein Cas7/Csd2 [Azospirillum brasilense]RIW04798.1 type I-C CRISPR-associated protein Cas7/Csd2 [Azospirillum brasilense]
MPANQKSPIQNRYEFVYLFDVTNGNPNGDPDAGNLPRLDPETNKGLVTDVCLKRKIRNYAALSRDGEPRYGIYVQEGAILNEKHRAAYAAVRPDDKDVATAKKLSPKGEEETAVRRFMCDNFFDVRSFGAVMSTSINCGQVRGPVQMSFAHSVEPILPLEISITRMAATSEKELKERKEGEAAEDERRENRTMGRKHVVPYGLYRSHGYISASLAGRTGFDEDDLELLWTALEQMFDHDRSAARGEMAGRKLFLFRHDSVLGNAPAHRLFDLVTVKRRFQGADYDLDGGGLDNLPPARRFADYTVSADTAGVPAGVTLIEKF